jgi:hypothetical protein
MFETGFDGWEYATHGGSLFIVNFRGHCYGVICNHVFRDFQRNQLIVTDVKFGSQVAGLRSFYSPSQPTTPAAEGSDLLDIVIVRFSDDVGPGFFQGTAYILEEQTAAMARQSDRLLVHGALKKMSVISESEIRPVFTVLEMSDDGPSEIDPVLRRASGKFASLEFDSLTGLSGGPVFDVTREKLAGVVVRGGLARGVASILYIDIVDVMEVLKAIENGSLQARYDKTVLRQVASSPRRARD